jgi:hypothetical protein
VEARLLLQLSAVCWTSLPEGPGAPCIKDREGCSPSHVIRHKPAKGLSSQVAYSRSSIRALLAGLPQHVQLSRTASVSRSRTQCPCTRVITGPCSRRSTDMLHIRCRLTCRGDRAGCPRVSVRVRRLVRSSRLCCEMNAESGTTLTWLKGDAFGCGRGITPKGGPVSVNLLPPQQK